ncbi:hypothetical protein HMPREF1598_00633 [Escherichia coli 907710]|nr:hypothetical protein HMPREF1590_01168 [Escherichia coli 113302]ESD27873.1 hypothetical protein HMPREF1598_00633 [Escherichia coli 907710]CAQ99049.1 hypothetical protein (contains two Ankyrin domain (Interpro)) [Escherichia coli IAI1]
MKGWCRRLASTQNKGITCEHDATNSAERHKQEQGDDPNFSYAHIALLMLTKGLYSKAHLLTNH